jgi:hypothetical protein
MSRRLYLYPESLKRLPSAQRKVWERIATALLSCELQEVFKHKFRAVLANRFGKNIDRLSFYPVPILVRDLPGYRIPVHSDVPQKAITVQFYLPCDASHIHLGTTFHEAKDGPGLENTTTLKFLPASGYAFPVNLTASWHSVKPSSEADGARNSMMVTYYVQDTAHAWFQLRRQRLFTSLGRPPSR